MSSDTSTRIYSIKGCVGSTSIIEQLGVDIVMILSALEVFESLLITLFKAKVQEYHVRLVRDGVLLGNGIHAVDVELILSLGNIVVHNSDRPYLDLKVFSCAYSKTLRRDGKSTQCFLARRKPLVIGLKRHNTTLTG